VNTPAELIDQRIMGREPESAFVRGYGRQETVRPLISRRQFKSDRRIRRSRLMNCNAAPAFT
jgi:hypothetical protein